MRLDRRILTLALGGLLAACSNGMQSRNDAGADTAVASDVATDSSRDVTMNPDTAPSDVPAMDAPAVDAPASDVPAMDVQTADAPASDVPATDVPAVDVPTRDVNTSRTCGGLLGLTCAPSEFCSYAITDMCGAADQTGMCQPIPAMCPPTTMPVCGCDGVTYTNECEANRAGTSAAATGACTTPSDCRTTSCPRGQYCAPCRGIGGATYVCLPVGAVC